ncbi:response regulator [Pseudomonas mangiferae]|uniref:histidine kinase n=1 Tax=Pseudomonas mangiferae TaxID=2593654 RepID=A0A553GVW8_9PSED|nr:response regulator [Pseudomonas mangiferae]TRX73647.1 response regulator [Pseudomonas mangiferae]
MPNASIVDESGFRRILLRNIRVPMAMGIVGAGLFVALIGYLLYLLSWVEHTDIVIGNVNDAYRTTIDQETGLRGYLLTGDVQFLQPYEQARPRLKADMAGLAELVSDNPPQVNRAHRIQELQEEWGRYASEMIALRRDGRDVGNLIPEARGKPLMDAIRQEFTDFVALEQRLRHERNEKASNAALLIIILYPLLSLGFSAVMGVFSRRDLISLSGRYDDSLQKQMDYTEHLRHQAWMREGQSLLAERILGHQSSEEIGRQLLAFLASYLGVAVAALYVREENGDLTRVATYGFAPEHQGLHQRLRGGEGLVGQVAREQRTLVFEGLPPRYLKVNSSLAEGDPLSVMVVPTILNGQLNGVLELGFLRPLASRDRALVESVTSSLAASIEAARYRERLHEVLTETQQLNEELQVQQEELRTANEELESQAQVILQSQASLEVQQTELEQTNLRLNEQAQRLVQQRDALDEQNRFLSQARQQVEAHSEELQRASRYKSEFLANMSHELRTPLNSALILAKVLTENRKGNLDEEQLRYLRMIHSSGTDLLRLINDILDISKVEAGHLQVCLDECGVPELVQGLHNAFQPLAQEKQLSFSVILHPKVPRTIHTDRHRVEQILRNLLSNAIKFTEKGEVDLEVHCDEGGVRFDVRDSGIGISAEQCAFIFEPFRQVDGSNKRRYGGTGLGLSISRDLAQLLHGRVEVESELGKGSRFSLWLPERCDDEADDTPPPSAEPPPVAEVATPIAEAPATPAADASGEILSAVPRSDAALADDRDRAESDGRSILVIEAEPPFARSLYELAHELDYRCLIADSASEGIALAEEQAPDAILLDTRLPDDSGLSVLQRLKENPRTRHIPVHVFSALDYSEPALHLGAIGYASKPVTREQLQDVFSRLEAKITQKVKQVLLVEGNAQQRETFSQLIGDGDIRISTAERGEEALALLHGDPFDCMIVDVDLPDMRLAELFQQMTRDEDCSFPPVIVYASRRLSRDEEQELLEHSRSLIIKGARSPEHLLDEVTLFLHQVEAELPNDRQQMLQQARSSQDRILEKRCILVVDDDVRNVYALTGALDLKGLKVETARNGEEALERLGEVEGIDLVLMDIMMPVMDGYEAMRRIRLEPRWQNLPIIAVTAKAMKEDHEQCMAAGANDYMAKPIDIERLYSLIRVWLPKRQRF